MSSQPSISDFFSLPIEKLDYSIFCSHNHQFIFVLNQRVASFTVIKNLYYLITDEYPEDENLIFHRDTTIFPSFASDEGAQQLATLLAENQYFTFTFVCNPYTRILSSYLFLIEDVKQRDHRALSMEQQFNLPKDYNLSFLEFLLHVREQEYRHMDAHWRPQSFSTGINRGIKYDFIGRTEQIEQDLEKVLHKLSPTKSWQITHDTNDSNDVKQLLQQYYDYNEQALVEEIYADDFRYFGYGYELPLS